MRADDAQLLYVMASSTMSLLQQLAYVLLITMICGDTTYAINPRHSQVVSGPLPTLIHWFASCWNLISFRLGSTFHTFTL